MAKVYFKKFVKNIWDWGNDDFLDMAMETLKSYIAKNYVTQFRTDIHFQQQFKGIKMRQFVRQLQKQLKLQEIQSKKRQALQKLLEEMAAEDDQDDNTIDWLERQGNHLI